MSDLTTTNNGVKFISGNNKPFYGWYKEGSDAICNLGQMRKAVLVRKMLGIDKYYISEGSYYPFSRDVYEMRFDTLEEAVNIANNILVKWLSETYKNLGL